MPRTNDTPRRQNEFFDRLTAEDSSISQILKQMGLTPLQFAGWARSLRFRIRLKRYLKMNRQMARLEIIRSSDLAAKRGAAKAFNPDADPADQKGEFEVVKATRALEPPTIAKPAVRTVPSEGDSPHLEPGELERELEGMRAAEGEDGN